MILAAYMVAGFLVASIYAVGMLRGRRDRLHRLGLLIPLTIALHRDPDPDLRRRHRRARSRRPPAGQVRRLRVHPGDRQPNQTEYIGGICTDDGVKGAIGIPDLDSYLVGFSADTVVTGLEDIPPDERPPANTLLHLSFDTMVGIGTALLALGAWLGWSSGGGGATFPQTPWFLRAVAVSGRRRGRRDVVRLDRHRGRPPALDRPGLHAHLGSGDRGGGALVRLRRRAGALRGARHDGDPRPARDVAPLARGAARTSTRPTARRRRSCRRMQRQRRHRR